MNPDIKRLQTIIGHSYSDRQLLLEALTHSSSEEGRNYQRLEFLGDRVLGLVIAAFLYESFPGESEGDMARRFSALVDKPMLAKVAGKIDLGNYIIMSESERASGGSENESILSDVMEALIGAAFLDAGLDTCEQMIKSLWGSSLYETLSPPIDPKTALQEWTQGCGLGLPQYELAGRTGPDHAPVFTISVKVEGLNPVSATGSSRRNAEKKAAEKMLDILGGKENGNA
jgi:ribonuclease-3